MLLGAEDVDQGGGIHAADMLGVERQARLLQRGRDALVHGAQPADGGEQAERTAARRGEQLAVGRRHLVGIVARQASRVTSQRLVSERATPSMRPRWPLSSLSASLSSLVLSAWRRRRTGASMASNSSASLSAASISPGLSGRMSHSWPKPWSSP